MKLVLDALWRAAAYCLHPRVIAWSLLPLVIAAAAAAGLRALYWDTATAAVRGWLDGWSLLSAALDWLESAGAVAVRDVLPSLIVVALAAPVIVLAALLLVSLLITPALVNLVARRRFPKLERRHGAALWQGVASSLGWSLVALALLVVSIPLWFVPPLVLVIPPLIWGWLTYRVLGNDVLADHASADERRAVMRQHRWSLLAIGVVTGYLGAAPSLLWGAGALVFAFAPVLIVVTVWLYTLVFAFSALWFAHFALGALQGMRDAGRCADRDGSARQDRIPNVSAAAPPAAALPPL
jgi:hypothetical protein